VVRVLFASTARQKVCCDVERRSSSSALPRQIAYTSTSKQAQRSYGPSEAETPSVGNAAPWWLSMASSTWNDASTWHAATTGVHATTRLHAATRNAIPWYATRISNATPGQEGEEGEQAEEES